MKYNFDNVTHSMGVSNAVITRGNEESFLVRNGFAKIDRLLKNNKVKNDILKRLNAGQINEVINDYSLNYYDINALSKRYEDYCGSKNKIEEKNDIVNHDKLITGILKKDNKYYVVRGSSRILDTVAYNTKDRAYYQILKETKQNIKMISASYDSYSKAAMSENDYNYFHKWKLYFEHQEALDGVKRMELSPELRLIVYGYHNERYKNTYSTGRYVDYHKLNNQKYEFSKIKEDITVIRKIFDKKKEEQDACKTIVKKVSK